MIEATRSMTAKKTGEQKPPPKVLVWIPPGGTPVSCPNLHEAGLMASRFAGEHPGKTVAVYELVGTANVPLTYPEVIPEERESATLALPPAGEATA